MKGRACLITGASSGIGRATALALASMGADAGAVVSRPWARARRRPRPPRRPGRRRWICCSPICAVSRNASRRGRVPRQRPAAARADQQRRRGEPAAQRHRRRHRGDLRGQPPRLLPAHEAAARAARASAPARIINVASEAHKFGPLDFDDLRNERRYRSMRVYGQSKLANILFTAELARRLRGQRRDRQQPASRRRSRPAWARTTAPGRAASSRCCARSSAAPTAAPRRPSISPRRRRWKASAAAISPTAARSALPRRPGPGRRAPPVGDRRAADRPRRPDWSPRTWHRPLVRAATFRSPWRAQLAPHAGRRCYAAAMAT